MDKRVYDLLLENCDPKSYKEFLQLLGSNKKNKIYFIREEAVACYYLGEFNQCISLLNQVLPKVKRKQQKLLVYYWLGLSYIFTEERELFHHCFSEMNLILQSGKLKKKEQLKWQSLVNKLSLLSEVILEK